MLILIRSANSILSTCRATAASNVRKIIYVIGGRQSSDNCRHFIGIEIPRRSEAEGLEYTYLPDLEKVTVFAEKLTGDRV